MRFLARLHATVALVVCTVLYLTFSLHHTVKIRVHQAWTGSSTTVVAFGDSWSAVDPDPRGTVSTLATKLRLAAAPGKPWVERLCSEILCSRINNYAPYPTDPAARFGSVVDSSFYRSLTSRTNSTISADFLSDFKSQLQEFLADEDRNGWRSNTTSTVFTVFFGLGDIWSLADVDLSEATQLVSTIVESLFEQLDLLADAVMEETEEPLTVVLPKVPDPTWLAIWLNERTGPMGSDRYGLAQRQAVLLADRWNRDLAARAAVWDGGDIIIPDFHQWMLDQMREPKRGEYGFKGLLLGKYGVQSTFTELRAPCVSYTALNTSKRADQTTCRDASHHLFWDDTRLSGAAHELLGKHVADLVKHRSDGNVTLSDALRR